MVTFGKINFNAVSQDVSRSELDPSIMTNDQCTIVAKIYLNEADEGYYITSTGLREPVYCPATGNVQRVINVLNLTKFFPTQSAFLARN